MALIAVFTTVADEADGRRLAEAAIAANLAACVQQDRITSTYRWQGQVQHEAEVRLLFKTTAEAYAALEALIRRLHPYELPAIYALPVVAASAAYAEWVAGSVEPPG